MTTMRTMAGALKDGVAVQPERRERAVSARVNDIAQEVAGCVHTVDVECRHVVDCIFMVIRMTRAGINPGEELFS